MGRYSSGEWLKVHAEHFGVRDWDYTRLHKIKHIRYEDDYSGYDHPLRRVKRLFSPSPAWVRRIKRMLYEDKGAWYKITYAWGSLRARFTVGLRTDKHTPDGVLVGGNVITHWEETGEYLQLVQPSVGSLLAKFLIEEPNHPHAQAISAEIERIRSRYDERCDAGEVDGRKRDAEQEL